MSYKGIIKDRNFTLYAIGQATSQLGSAMAKAGFALYVLHATGSAEKFSTVLAVGFVPMLLLYPFTGALVDRMDRRKLLVGLDLARAVFLLGLLSVQLVTPLGLWTVLTYVLFSSVCETFANPAGNTIVPYLFSKEKYDLANSANAWALNAASIAAPALGVWAFTGLGLAGLLFVDALTFLVGAICSSQLRLIPNTAPIKPQTTFAQVEEGLALLRRKELALPTLAIAVSRAFIDPIYALVIPFLLISVLKQNDFGISLTQAASILGLLTAPWLVSNLRSRFGTLASLQLSRAGKILVFLVYAIVGPLLVSTPLGKQSALPIAFFSAVCFAGAFFNSAGFAFLNTYFQKSVHKELLGRFAASRFLIYALAQPIGLKLYGVILDDRWFGFAFLLAAGAAIAETLLLRTLKEGGQLGL